MCAPSQGAMLPYGLKVPSPYFPFGPNGGLAQVHLSALDFQRSQMNDYNVRVQLGLRNYQNAVGLSSFHAYFNDPYTQAYFYKHDPRSRFVQEEPKPSHSYIGLIGMAILNSKDKKLVLSDIYQWILDNYPYFRTRGPGWRNSIRHNLSLNDCFIKAGRSANGKGHYWAVHPANVEDFERGDFRRRRAQRKVRRHMGLSVPDDDDSPTPSPTQSWPHHDLTQGSDVNHSDPITISNDNPLRPISARSESNHMVISHSNPTYGPVPGHPRKPSRKRLFDMASLLAPDDDEDNKSAQEMQIERLHGQQVHVSGFMFHPIQDQKPHSVNTEQNTDNIEPSSTHDQTVSDNRRASNNGNEVNFLSDDDQENDEIQVTSDEESPLQEHDDCFYTNSRFSCENKYEKDLDSLNTSRMSVDTGSHEQSTNTSSSHNTELTDENALDLSSPIYFVNEKKPSEFTNTEEVNNSFDTKMLGYSPKSKDDGTRILQNTGQLEDSPVKKEPGCEKCNGYGGSETLNDRCVISTPKVNCSGCEQIRQVDSDVLMSKSSYRDRCKPQGEQLCSIINGGLDNVRSSADKLHYYCSELQEPRRQHNLGRGDSNFEPMDNSVLESDRRNDVDTRGLSSDSSVSDAARGPSDLMRWADMSKMGLSRDRLSAFSTLGIRNHCIYSPFQLRSFPPIPQRHASAATPMRTGTHDPLLSISAPATTNSITLLKDLDSSTSKIRHISNNVNSNKIASNRE